MIPQARVVAFLASLTPAQTRQARSALRASLNGAVEWARVRAPRYARNEPLLRETVLATEERAALAAAPVTTREQALLAACYVLRRFEVAALRWADLDLETGRVFVRRGKGGKTAWTLLPPGPLAALRTWHTEARPVSADAPVFPVGWTKPRTTVPEDGFPLADTIGHWVRAILTRAGLRRRCRGPHALRRTFATEFLRRNPKELEQLRVLMRHASIGTTSLYTYLLPDDLRPAVDRLEL